MLANFLLAVSHNSVNTLVSTYATYLGAAPKLMGLLTGMFFGIALAMRPVAGPLTTRIDKRKLLICVFSLGVVVNLGYALFHTIPIFVVFRFLNGVQYSFVGSLCVTVATDSLPKEKMASGLGVFGVSGAVAISIAPTIGLWLKGIGESLRDTDLGFTFVFIFAALCMVLAIIPSIILDPDKKTKEQLAEAGKWYQTIASKHAVAPALLMMLIIISYSIYNSYMVNYGAELGIASIGTFFTVLSIVLLASRPLSGTLTDKFGLLKIMIPGIIIFAASFIIIGSANGLALILVGAFVAAVGYGAANPAIQSMCMQSETPIRRAVASNTLYVGMDLGFFLGPVIGGYIRDVSDFRHVILFGTIPTILSVFVLLITWKSYKKRIDELEKSV